jgi:hypothetical protein
MPKPLEDVYFEWLVSQIKVKSDNSYDGLFERLHQKFFAWTVPNDDNRAGDGIDLRYEFLGERDYAFQFGVSVLEVLVALSRRVAFNAGGNASVWAWKLITNLWLHKCTDPLTRRKEDRIDDILETLIWRTYSPSGQGGFFPLKRPKEDQTKVEIWYQMSAYILENV